MATYVMRLWVSDRPGSLGHVATAIGTAGGDVVGIEIIERGAGRAVDELTVELAPPGTLDELVAAVTAVEGVDVEDAVLAIGPARDPRIQALDAAIVLVEAGTPSQVLDGLLWTIGREVGAEWTAVVDLVESVVLCAEGPAPSPEWLVAFAHGSVSAGIGPGPGGTGDVTCATLEGTDLAVVAGRPQRPLRWRERREVSALSRIAGVRLAELTLRGSLLTHPSTTR